MFIPDDDNGDVLRRMVAKGDDLTRPRNIDFSVLFADQSSAEKFAEHFRSLGYDVSVKGGYPKPDSSWDVTVVRRMPASHEGITDLENLLQSVADRWGGRNDGWGCFSGPSDQLCRGLLRHNVAVALTDTSFMPRPWEMKGALDLVTADFVYVRWLGNRKGIAEQTTTWGKTVVDRQDDLRSWVVRAKASCGG